MITRKVWQTNESYIQINMYDLFGSAMTSLVMLSHHPVLPRHTASGRVEKEQRTSLTLQASLDALLPPMFPAGAMCLPSCFWWVRFCPQYGLIKYGLSGKAPSPTMTNGTSPRWAAPGREVPGGTWSVLVSIPLPKSPTWISQNL